MSDKVAKEQLTAYQRWELPAFDIVEKPIEVNPTPNAMYPTAEEVEQIHKQAYDESYAEGHAEGSERGYEEGHQQGYEKGHEEGHLKGYDEGYEEGAQKARSEEEAAHEESQRLIEMIGGLDKELQQVNQQVAQSLLDLSMELAKKMLHQALKVQPELLLGVINEAINDLPHFSQHVRLILHPTDAELVRSKMGEQLEQTGWKIFEDTKIEPGGCRVETMHSQIDASLATRWKRVVASIGQDNSWLES